MDTATIAEITGALTGECRNENPPDQEYSFSNRFSREDASLIAHAKDPGAIWRDQPERGAAVEPGRIVEKVRTNELGS